MLITTITLEGEANIIDVIQSGTDVYIKQYPGKGVPYDAGDEFIWNFCADILKILDGPPYVGPPMLRIAEIYNSIKPLLYAAEEKDRIINEGDPS